MHLLRCFAHFGGADTVAQEFAEHRSALFGKLSEMASTCWWIADSMVTCYILERCKPPFKPIVWLFNKNLNANDACKRKVEPQSPKKLQATRPSCCCQLRNSLCTGHRHAADICGTLQLWHASLNLVAQAQLDCNTNCTINGKFCCACCLLPCHSDLFDPFDAIPLFLLAESDLWALPESAWPVSTHLYTAFKHLRLSWASPFA